MPTPTGRLVTPLGYNPADALTPLEVNASGYLIVTIDPANNPLVSAHGFVNGAWRKSPIPFGYSDVLNSALANLALAAGANNLDSAAVGAGLIWVVTNVSVMYVGTAPTSVSVNVVSGGATICLFQQNAPVTATRYDRQGKWVLEATDILRCTVVGATLNDDLYLDVHGYQIAIEL